VRRFIIISAFCLLSALAFGQSRRLLLAHQPSVLTPGFTPDSISGMAYYWNFLDMPTNGAASNWVDRIQSVSLKQGNSAKYPTNTASGVYFIGGLNLTNVPLSIASNFSVWLSIQPEANSGGYKNLLSDDGGSSIGFFLNNLLPDFFFTSDHYLSGSVTLDYPFDLVWANKNAYSNGVSSATTTSPGSTWAPKIVGSDHFNQNYNGFIKYIGIWTNKAISSVDASNLTGFSQGFPDASCPLSITQEGLDGADAINGFADSGIGAGPGPWWWIGNAFKGNGSNLCRVDMSLIAFTNAGLSCATQNVYVTVGVSNSIASASTTPCFTLPVSATSRSNTVPDSTAISGKKWIPFTFNPPFLLTNNQWFVIAATTADRGSGSNFIRVNYSATTAATNITHFGEWQSSGYGGTNAFQNEGFPTFGTGMRLYFSVP